MKKKMGMGGMHMMPDGSMMKNSSMKKGGSVDSSKKPKVGPVKPGIVKPAGPKGVAPGTIKPSMKMGGTSKALKSIFKKK